jgi:hypothetical protein
MICSRSKDLKQATTRYCTLDFAQHYQGLFFASTHLNLSIGFETSRQGACNDQRPKPGQVDWD